MESYVEGGIPNIAGIYANRNPSRSRGKGFKFDKLNEFAEPVDGAYLVPKPLVPVRRTSKLQVPPARPRFLNVLFEGLGA